MPVDPSQDDPQTEVASPSGWPLAAGAAVCSVTGLTLLLAGPAPAGPTGWVGVAGLVGGAALAAGWGWVGHRDAAARAARAEADARAVHEAHGRAAQSEASANAVRAAAEEVLARAAERALQDPTTGLPNRQLVIDRIEAALKRVRRSEEEVAVLLVDVDRFGDLHQVLGPERSEALIAEIGLRLQRCVRETDTVGRLARDEFVLVLDTLGERAGIDRVIAAVRDQFAALSADGQRPNTMTASLGVVIGPHEAQSADDLLRFAAQALGRAKIEGRDRCYFYTPELGTISQRRLKLGTDLQFALAGQQLFVVYQPIIHLKTREVHKAEALARWRHPQEGMVSPMDFIPIAESNGLIGSIGEWVFQASALQAKRWRDTLHPQFQISVNRSPAQFRDDDLETPSWVTTLAEMGIPGDSIALEITEGVLLEPSERLSRQLARLRDAGVRLSLDDFGTGYSSISYLQRHDMDYVKIDRAFVHGLAPGSKQMVFCQSIIAMAHGLGLQVVAEGVETAEQEAILVALECDYAQGYFYGRPMPADELEARVKNDAPTLIPPSTPPS